MTIDHSFMAKKLSRLETIYVLVSTATNLPFVECDENTFSDQVYVFSREEEMKQYAAIYTKSHYGLRGLGYPQRRIEELYDLFHEIGADTVQVVDGGAPIAVPLAALAPEPDYSDLPGGDDLPKTNPALQLTAIYFAQEVRRGGERSEKQKKRLRELEEEMAVNMFRSRFIITFNMDKAIRKINNAKPQLRVPFVKNKSGKIFQPVYTDLCEFRRFARTQPELQKMTVTAVVYDKLSELQAKEAASLVINPGGVNLALTADQLVEMKRRYGKEDT